MINQKATYLHKSLIIYLHKSLIMAVSSNILSKHLHINIFCWLGYKVSHLKITTNFVTFVCIWSPSMCRYGENVLEVNDNPDWICPVCRGICNCSRCRRVKGWAPTGQIYKKVDSISQLIFFAYLHSIVILILGWLWFARFEIRESS